jgi:exodeoxyribonuclease VII large subunit
MPEAISLSELSYQVQEAIIGYFDTDIIWVKAEISDVKKYASKRWCFLTLVEKQGENIVAKFKANIWAYGYNALQKFEAAAKRPFENGLEIICAVKISSHAVYGLAAEIVDIDISFTLGKIENDRQLTLEKLLTDFPQEIRLIRDEFITTNNQLHLPIIPQRIALIGAKNSDGFRDFLKELLDNNYGYQFKVTVFNVSVQGESAVDDMCKAIQLINESKNEFDIVALVRGGGSLLDFKPFNEFALAAAVATCKIPILSGIGHDSNTSIVDLMSRQYKTPTKVAAYILDILFDYESNLLGIQEQIFLKTERMINTEKQFIAYSKRLIKSAHPDHWLKKGFAIVTQNEKIRSSASQINSSIDLNIKFIDGTITAQIKTIENGQ